MCIPRYCNLNINQNTCILVLNQRNICKNYYAKFVTVNYIVYLNNKSSRLSLSRQKDFNDNEKRNFSTKQNVGRKMKRVRSSNRVVIYLLHISKELTT